MVESRALIPGSGMGGGLVTQVHPALLQSEFTPDAENMQFSRGGAGRRPGLAPFAMGAVRGGAIAPVVEMWKGPADDDNTKEVWRREWGGCAQIPWSHYFDEDHVVIYFNYTPDNIDLYYLNRYASRTKPYRQTIIGVPWVMGYKTGVVYANKNGWRWQIGIAHKNDALFGGSPPSEGDYFFFLRVDNPGLAGDPTKATYIHCAMPVQEGTRYEVRVRLDKTAAGKYSFTLVTCREDGYCCTTESGELTTGWDPTIKKPIQVFGPFHPDITLTESSGTTVRDVPAEGKLERLVIMDGSLIGDTNDPTPNLFGMSQRIDTTRFSTDLADVVFGYWPGESDYDGWIKDYGPHGIHGYYVPSRASVRVDERPAVQLDPFNTTVCRAFSFHSKTASSDHTEQDILRQWMGRRIGGGTATSGEEFDFIMGGTFKLDGQAPFGWREGRQLVSIFGDDYTASPLADDPYPWYVEPLFSVYLTEQGDLAASVCVGTGIKISATATFTGDLVDRLSRILVRFNGTWNSSSHLVVQFDFYINGKQVGSSVVEDTTGSKFHGGPRWIVAGPFSGKVYDLQIFGVDSVFDPLDWDSSMEIDDLDLPDMFNWHRTTPASDVWEFPERSTKTYSQRDAALIPVGYIKDLSLQDRWASVFNGRLDGNRTIAGFAYPTDGGTNNINAEANGRFVATRIVASWRCKRTKFFQPKLPTRLCEIHKPTSGVQNYHKEWLTGLTSDVLLESENGLFGDLYVGTVHHTKAFLYEHPTCPLVERHWPLFFRSHYDLGVRIVPGELLPAEKDHGVRLLTESGSDERVVLAGAGRTLFVHERAWRSERGLTLFGREKSYWWGPAGNDMVPQSNDNFSTNTLTFAFRYQRGSRDRANRLIFSIGKTFWGSTSPTQLPNFWVSDEDGQLVIRGRHYAAGVEITPFEYKVVDIWKTSIANTSSSLFADFKKHWVVIEVDPDATVKVRVWVDGIELQVWSVAPIASALPSTSECNVVVFGGNPWALHAHANSFGVSASAGKGWIEEFYVLGEDHTHLPDYGLSLGGGWHGSSASAPLFAGDFREEPASEVVDVTRNGETAYVRLRGSDLIPISSDLPNLNGWRPKIVEYGDEFFLACESGEPRRIWKDSPPALLLSEGWHVDRLGFPLVPTTVITRDLVTSSADSSASGYLASAAVTSNLDAGTYSVYISFYDEKRDAHSPLISMGTITISAGDDIQIYSMPRLPYGEATHTYIWVNSGTGYQLARILSGTDVTHCKLTNIDYPGTTITFEYGEPPVARTLEMASGRLVLGGLARINDRAYVGSGAGNPYVFPAENYVVAGSADSGEIRDLVHVLGRILIVHPRRLSWLTIPGAWATIREDQVTGYQGFVSVHDPKRLENIVAGMTAEGPAILNETVLLRKGMGIMPSMEGLLSNPWMLTVLPSTGEWLFIPETDEAFSEAFSLVLGEQEVWAPWTLPAVTATGGGTKSGTPVQLIGVRSGRVLYFNENSGDGVVEDTIAPETAVMSLANESGLFKAAPASSPGSPRIGELAWFL